MQYKVVEIFDSIDGEGIRTGLPVSFIRLAGCNLRCSYCDTLYALFGESIVCEYSDMDENEILEKLNPRFKRVTLTGGEPLIAPGIGVLLEKLAASGYEINIETNGAVDIESFSQNPLIRENAFFTIDYKLLSSGMNDKMIYKNFFSLTPRDAVKFVVGSDEDVKKMIALTKEMEANYSSMPQIYIGAVYEKFSLEKLAETILSTPSLANAKLQVQLHKIVWDPDKRGV